MVVNNPGRERPREQTRRSGSKASVFLPGLAGTGEGDERVVVRNEIHVKALEAARQVLRLYHSERRRQL